MKRATQALREARGNQEEKMVMPALMSPSLPQPTSLPNQFGPVARASAIVMVLQSMLIAGLLKAPVPTKKLDTSITEVAKALESPKDSVQEPEGSLALSDDQSLKVKIEIFQSQGRLLRENADRFLSVANQKYESEAYDEANQLYMSLYEVYKDNRMAVDAVRLLSRTQKVQNILESVREYVSKKQYISAVKKLEEIKHLVSAELFRKHYDSIESERIRHQEGNQNP
jgi:hypothetical protein